VRSNLVTRIFLLATLLGSGGYVVLYLWRWEWNRALISGLFFLAAEAALLAGAITRRLQRVEDQLTSLQSERVDAARSHLVATRPAASDRFEWLRSSIHRSNVFVPVLMGAGVLLSGVAWVVERIARATARPALERRLAERVAPLLYIAPEGGLVPPAEPGGVVPRALRPRSR
jgi:hypothetical protein